MDNKPRRKNYFLTGLVAVLPLALSLYVLWMVFSSIGKIASPLCGSIFAYLDVEYSTFYVDFVSVVLTFVLIWFIGVLATNIFGRKLFRMFEKVLVRVPVLKGFYTSIRQLLTHFFSEKMAFKQVVLVQYPRLGLYSIGFVTCDATGQVQEAANEHLVNIFIPTTPNPTSGMLIIIPKKDIIFLQMSVDDAVKLIISAGLISPGRKKQNLIKENL